MTGGGGDRPMTTRLRIAACAALATLLFAGAAFAQASGVDRDDPSSVAAAYLNAARERDAAAMAELASGFQAIMLRDVAGEGDASELIDEAFGDWRGAQIDAWDGRLYPPLDGGPGQIEIRFGPPIDRDRVSVVVLRQGEDGWAVRDLIDAGGPSDDLGPIEEIATYYPLFEALPEDRSDPWAVAERFVLAAQYRDLTAMAQRTAAANRILFGEIARTGGAHLLWETVFGGWRGEAIDAWSGEAAATRFSHTGWALYALTPPAEDGLITFLVLVEEDGGWVVGDVNQLDLAAFEALPTERP